MKMYNYSFGTLTFLLLLFCSWDISTAVPFARRGGGIRRSGLLNKSPFLSNLLKLEAKATQAQQKEDPAQLCADLWDFHNLDEARADSLETGENLEEAHYDFGNSIATTNELNKFFF